MTHDAMYVMLAEDDEALRDLLSELLEGRGHRVVACGSGHALLNRLGSALLGLEPMPDVIVTDDRMPGARGSDVLEGLHDGRWPVPAVLVTAFPSQELEARARAVGATLVGKPFDAEELVRAVEAAGRGQASGV